MFHYERCGADRFRVLCSAVLEPDHPGLVTLGHGATGTGRQGFDRSPTIAGRACAHVAFSPTLALDGTAEWLLASLASELPRIRHAAVRGASRFIVVTNVSRPDSEALEGPGSVHAWLAENCPIPASCLWREDLDRRIDWGSPTIKLAHPEILEPGVVSTVVAGMLDGLAEPASQSLTAFVRRQSDRAAARSGFFVDVPDHSGLGAAGVLLSDAAGNAPWRVLVGDPGSGKSVVAEHVCQVHRARLLGDDRSLEPAGPREVRTAFRLPISVDAREYADHLRAGGTGPARPGTEPFARFLGALIGGFLPGEPLTPEEVRTILLRVPVLVVIDRLDELGHRATREQVTGTALDYLAQLRALGADIQVIVASRPEAYGPLPDSARLHALRLAPLTTEAIIELVERWLDARPYDHEAGVLQAIADGLELTDFRSLAATPLHLTLALERLADSGSTLPGRRADFFERGADGGVPEARSTSILREHRHLVPELLHHLAWVLQCESESGQSSGTIDANELVLVVQSFLADRDEPRELATALFDAIECLPVLVEGLDGRFGFREHYVRELLCARHLFRSAPVSSAGRRGTDDRSARFAVLAANPQWTNVARFFAGFYEPGALPALIANLTKTIASRDLAISTRGRELGGILLADRVFRDRGALRDALVCALYDRLGVRLAALGALGIGYRAPETDCGRGILRNLLLREHVLSDTPAIPAIARLLSPIGGQGLWGELVAPLAARTGADRTALLSAAFAADAHLGVPATEIDAVVNDDSPTPHDLHARLAALLDTTTTAFSHSPRLAHDLIAGLLRWGPSGSSHASGSLRHFATVLGEGDDTVSIIEQLAVSRDYGRAAEAVEAIRAEFGDSWATFALAAATCGIPRLSEIRVEAHSLLDARLPLCNRALAARVWRGSELWWAEELARAGNVSERMFWVAVLVSWGNSHHVSTQLPAIDSVLAELDAEQLRLVIDAVRAAREAREAHGGRHRPPVLLPESVGDRTALLVALSFGSPSLASIATGRGTSELVARCARQSLIRQRVSAFESWDALGESAAVRWVAAVAAARLLGDELSPAVADRASRGTMRLAAARRVLLATDDHPAVLVESALRSIQSARRPTSVGEAALGWSL